MKEQPGVMFYFEHTACFDLLTDAEVGKLTKSVLHYAKSGEEPRLEGTLAIIWTMMRSVIARDAKRYEMQCRQKSYAVYCREQDRQGRDRLSYEEWLHPTQYSASDDNGPYPNTDTDTDKVTDIAANTNTPTSKQPPQTDNTKKGYYGEGKGIRLTDNEYMTLMDELGFDRLHDTMRSAERYARQKGYRADTMDWVYFLRYYADNRMPKKPKNMT